MRRPTIPLLALLALPAAASTTAWTYTPPASGTKGTISWTDSSGFTNVMKGAVLSDGLITFSPGSNTSTTTLRNIDLSVPVYAEDGITQYAFSPYALGDANMASRIASGSSITNIVLHSSCKSLGQHCFRECSNLVKVTLNDGLEAIHANAFYACKKLVTIENFLPDTVKVLGSSAFSTCNALEGDCSAKGLVSMADRVFINCYALRSFDARDSSLDGVGESAFYGDTGLVSVFLPDTVTNIAAKVFHNAKSLQNVLPLLPPKLAKLGIDSDPSFYNCPIEGHVISPHTLASIPNRTFYTARIETFTAPRKGLKRIGESVFFQYYNLTNIVLSTDLESLGATWLHSSGTINVEQHVWFRNLPASLPSSLWGNTKKHNITIHLPWSKEKEWREWVASAPSGHTFKFNGASGTLPEHRNDTGTWSADVEQYVTWWKDLEAPTVLMIK